MIHIKFPLFLYTAISLYFKQESDYTFLHEIPLDGDGLSTITGRELTWEEQIVLLLIYCHALSSCSGFIFFRHIELGRFYNEFEG